MLNKVFTILRALLYSAGFIFLWGWIAVSIRPYDAEIPLRLAAWLQPIGVALASAGALLAAACIATFATRGRGTPAPFDSPRDFVASGPYRYVRNPMYLGAAAVIAGAGLAVSSPSIVILASAALLMAHLLVVFYEEPLLADKFGASYASYRAHVRRWIPCWPASQLGR